MKLVCSKSNLLNGVQIVSKAVPNKTTMSILECILIDSTRNEIKLTANDMESDMLKGFESGADDYVTKPFPISVFQKKVEALASRMQRRADDDCYSDGRLSLDFSKNTAVLNGIPITFTPMEYRLLKLFTKNPGIVLTRQVLLERLWDTEGNFVDEHALTAAVSRVRGKLDAGNLQYIKTVYGMGYMWTGEQVR